MDFNVLEIKIGYFLVPNNKKCHINSKNISLIINELKIFFKKYMEIFLYLKIFIVNLHCKNTIDLINLKQK